jgi:NTP pyrophosphatase (non-canonical NTP hydrolase)
MGNVTGCVEFQVDNRKGHNFMASDRQVHRYRWLDGLNELAGDIHGTSLKHGWWPGIDEWLKLSPEAKADVYLSKLMLVVTEVAEMVEELRKHSNPRHQYMGKSIKFQGGHINKPEGASIEAADVFIRLLDFCAFTGIDIEAAIAEKMGFNDFREHRHGNKLA